MATSFLHGVVHNKREPTMREHTEFNYEGRKFLMQTVDGEVYGAFQLIAVVHAMQPHTRKVRIKGERLDNIEHAFKAQVAQS